MSDITNKNFQLPKLATVKNFNVNVKRVGVQVWVTIGNNDPWKFTWKEALTIGHQWTEESRAALRERRPAEMKFKHNKMLTGWKWLIIIARRVITQAVEAKILDGHTEIVEVADNALQE